MKARLLTAGGRYGERLLVALAAVSVPQKLGFEIVYLDR